MSLAYASDFGLSSFLSHFLSFVYFFAINELNKPVMDFFDLIRKRRACHHFLPGVQIPKEDIQKMIEAASLAPSGYNAQPWEFVVIQDSARLSRLQEIAYGQTHLSDASAAIVVLGDLNIGRNVDHLLEDWLTHGYCTEEEIPAYRNSIAKNRSEEKRKDMALRNAMMASMTLLYAAEELGYASCPMMGFNQPQMREFLELPDDRMVALLIAVGKEKPGEENPRLPRKSYEQLVHFEKWNDPENSH